MKKAVHFGAGKIGRGFIAELLHDSDYEIIFADVVDALVDLINEKHEYPLFLIEKDYEKKIIDHVKAYSTIKEPEKVIDAITEAELITTSVMATNLPKIAPIMAKGLKKRLDEKKQKMTVMACENAIMGTDILKKELADTGIITMDELDQVAVFPNTAVDRMVFDGTHDGESGIEIGKDYELAIEKEKLIDPKAEPIKGAEYVENLEMYLQRKIYIINGGHALTGYIGYKYGIDTVQEVIKNEEVFKEVRQAMLESASALEKKYGFSHESLVNYMQSMMVERFTAPGVCDPIQRVAREPIRKLSPNDRIMGPAYQCEKYGLDNTYLLKGAACAFSYLDENDPQSVELQNEIKEKGIEQAITKYTGAEVGSHVYETILKEYQELHK